MRISPKTLFPQLKTGYMVKEGGRYKSWKKRYFVLIPGRLWYFETPESTEAKGFMDISGTDKVETDTDTIFSFVGIDKNNSTRHFHIETETKEQRDEWVSAIVSSLKSSATTPSDDIVVDDTMQVSIRSKCVYARGTLIHIAPGSPQMQLWSLWTDCIPPIDEIPVTSSLQFDLWTTLSLNESRWAVCGEQKYMIPRAVDFFYNAGAQVSQIDSLNRMGSMLQPPFFGTEIRLSSRGYDAGWVMRGRNWDISEVVSALGTKIPVKLNELLSAWIRNCANMPCIEIYEDMSPIPPRTCALTFEFPSGSFHADQMLMYTNAVQVFAIMAMHEQLAETLKTLGVGGKGFPARITFVFEESDDATCATVPDASSNIMSIELNINEPSQEFIGPMHALFGTKNEVILPVAEAIGSSRPTDIIVGVTRPGKGHNGFTEGLYCYPKWEIGVELGKKQ